MFAIIALLFAALFTGTGTDAGLVTEPATEAGIVCGPYEWLDPEGTGCERLPGYEDDSWGEVPILPMEAYYSPDLCLPVPVEDVTYASDEAVSYLLSQGWAGREGDGMEALYPHGC